MAERKLGIPHARIRRIVGDMRVRRSEADVRADIRLRCDPKVWPPELIERAEEYAVRVYNALSGKLNPTADDPKR